MTIKQDLQHQFEKLRRDYPIFTYHSYRFKLQNRNTLVMDFDFRIGDKYQFTPKMTLNLKSQGKAPFESSILDGLVFHIGLVEMISYWKLACSPEIYINKYYLSEQQQQFWKKLFWKGLGEFRYQNSIAIDDNDFVKFRFADDSAPVLSMDHPEITKNNRVIVPIGGGKDSVVTLEQLSKTKEPIPFIINPNGANIDCARTAGYVDEQIVTLHRTIDPLLLQLNNKGFLNGHTPFSAMLAFYTLLVGYMTKTTKIALSNESSANEPTIPNTDINHQYSKSLEFEENFREYVALNMGHIAHYYSHLRAYSELEIAEMFAQYPQYFPVFRSCNAGSKQNIWCCNCPKCLFAYIILSPFIEKERLIQIFGENLLEKPSLKGYLDELTGKSPQKPFECVGTIDEVNEALRRGKK